MLSLCSECTGSLMRCYAHATSLSQAICKGAREIRRCPQPGDLGRPAGLQDIIKRLEPLARFDGVDLRGVFRSNVSHKTLVPFENDPSAAAHRSPCRGVGSPARRL